MKKIHNHESPAQKRVLKEMDELLEKYQVSESKREDQKATETGNYSDFRLDTTI